MMLNRLVYRVANDPAFAQHIQQQATQAPGIANEPLEVLERDALLTILGNDKEWHKLCDPRQDASLSLDWRSPSSSISLTHVESIWAAAGATSQYLEAMRAALPRKLSAQATGRSGSAALPSLPQLCCEAAGGDRQHAEPLVDAWNILYAALHVLDAIEDGDRADGAWAHWGTGPAINITTGLLASTHIVLDALEGAAGGPQVARAIKKDFSHTLLTMCGGQHGDLTLAEPTLERRWRVTEAKSAAFFALACRSGTLLACGDRQRSRLFGQFGHHLGMLIQIGDDIDGLRPTDNGRSDLRAENPWTLPVAYAMSVSSDKARDQLREYLRLAPTDPDAEARAYDLIISSGALLYLATRALYHFNAAYTILLRAASPSPARDKLLDLLQDLCPALKRFLPDSDQQCARSDTSLAIAA